MATKKSPAELKKEGVELDVKIVAARRKPHNFAMLISKDGIDIVCVPAFVELQIDDQERTAVCLSIQKRDDIETTEPNAESA